MKRMTTLAFAVLAAACGRGGERPAQSGADTSAAGGRVNLTGAGATFPYPVYSKWVLEYTRLHPGVQINYQSIGSGGGIRQFMDATVDFGATDGPMSDSQITVLNGNVLHIPTVIGAVVPAYNLPQITQNLRFTPEVLAGIFSGEIASWDDSRIASLHPGTQLPRVPIVVVHRSDGSGTTYVWTDYLSKVSPSWRQRVGRGTSVNWPVGLGARGNEGVASQVTQTPGAIGYVELVYATQNRITYGFVRNQSGQFVHASLPAVTAAAAVPFGPDTDFRVSITDPAARDGYPVASFTWVLIPRDIRDPAKARALLEFLWWATHEGQRFATDLGYAPLPEPVVRLVEERLKRVTAGGRAVLPADYRGG